MTSKITEYEYLLSSFAGNGRLLDLIQWCLVDEEEQREKYYRQYGHYPEKRELLWKLKTDLVNKKLEIGGNK